MPMTQPEMASPAMDPCTWLISEFWWISGGDSRGAYDHPRTGSNKQSLTAYLSWFLNQGALSLKLTDQIAQWRKEGNPKVAFYDFLINNVGALLKKLSLDDPRQDPDPVFTTRYLPYDKSFGGVQLVDPKQYSKITEEYLNLLAREYLEGRLGWRYLDQVVELQCLQTHGQRDVIFETPTIPRGKPWPSYSTADHMAKAVWYEYRRQGGLQGITRQYTTLAGKAFQEAQQDISATISWLGPVEKWAKVMVKPMEVIGQHLMTFFAKKDALAQGLATYDMAAKQYPDLFTVEERQSVEAVRRDFQDVLKISYPTIVTLTSWQGEKPAGLGAFPVLAVAALSVVTLGMILGFIWAMGEQALRFDQTKVLDKAVSAAASARKACEANSQEQLTLIQQIHATNPIKMSAEMAKAQIEMARCLESADNIVAKTQQTIGIINANKGNQNGMDMTTLLILAGVGTGAFFLLRK